MSESDVNGIDEINAETRVQLSNEFRLYMYGNAVMVMPLVASALLFSELYVLAPLPVFLFWWIGTGRVFFLARRHSPNLMRMYYGSALLVLLFGICLIFIGGFFILPAVLVSIVFHVYFYGIWRALQKKYKVEIMK